ncbi:TPA: hypothetical protein ACG7HH_004980 [Escherichia coli]
MTTITRENAEIKSFITGFLSDPAHDNQSSSSLLANVFRIALASLEAEPVAWRYRYVKKGVTDSQGDSWVGDWTYVPTKEDCNDRPSYEIQALFTAPPAPVVPEEKPMPNPLSMYAVDAVAAIAEVRGWNACRAAMLQGKGE